jgi:cellulose synthase/poly-beta-1,6-N-acetylglucosamine synthase-like glycosyltransferase
MVRREAFLAAGGFSADAITEDVDLAFKLNRLGWRVEQSFVAVDSAVPATLRAWVRQKLRWTAGGMQCYVRHVPVWIRNPSQIAFILAYSLLILSSIPAVLGDLRLGEDMMDFFTVMNRFNTVRASMVEVIAVHGRELLRRMLGSGLCCLLSTVYIFPLIRRPRQSWKLLLVFPFSLLYFPAYIVVSLFGIANGLRSLRRLLPSDVRGW